jgi:hypothetical protein
MHKCRTKLKHAQQIEHGKLTYLANISRRRPFQYIGQFSIKISYLPTNTAEKRLRMRQPCNSIANLMRSCSERFRRLKMAVKRSDFIVRLYSQILSAKINMSF